MFPRAGVRHLLAPNSDHSPILIDTHLEISGGSRPFRFKAMWVKDESSVNVVNHAWATPFSGSHSVRLSKKLQKTQKDLLVWNKTCFGVVNSRIKELEEKIKAIQFLELTLENLALEATLNIELNDWYERKELKWKQKLREPWLREGGS